MGVGTGVGVGVGVGVGAAGQGQAGADAQIGTDKVGWLRGGASQQALMWVGSN